MQALDLDQNTILATYQLESFLRSGHNYTSIISESLRVIIAHITSSCARLSNIPLQAPTKRTTRAGSAAAARESSVAEDSAPVAWNSRWTVDKTSLRADVKAFEEHIRHLVITPPTSSRRDLATIEEIIRNTPPVGMSQERRTSNAGRQPPPQGQPDPNNFNNTGFSEQQWRSFQSLLHDGPDDRPLGGGGGTPAPQQAEALPGRPLPLRPDDIGFFNPGAEGDGPVVGEKYVTFRDVFVFVDRLKEMKRRFNEEQVLIVILSCLKGTAITWHTAELSEFERVVLETANLEQWMKLLIRRFKEDTGEAVKLMYSEKFTMSDALSNADPRKFAQSIFRYARAAELGNAQLIVA